MELIKNLIYIGKLASHFIFRSAGVAVVQWDARNVIEHTFCSFYVY